MEAIMKNRIDPMIEALVMDNDRQIDRLISQGTDPNQNVSLEGGKHKNKPLHYAAFYNSVKAAKRLIAAGADIQCMNGRGATPFKVAEMHEAYKVLHMFREMKKANKRAITKKKRNKRVMVNKCSNYWMK